MWRIYRHYGYAVIYVVVTGGDQYISRRKFHANNHGHCRRNTNNGYTYYRPRELHLNYESIRTSLYEFN